MGNDWTEDQKRIISHSEGDLLVAAAAGSGKTAVLVERIVTMLRDEKHPIEIDRMLVVTFTRAAAAEMRERIGRRISELLTEEPENERLQRQQLLLHHAPITTLDSFCLQVIREFFHTIGLDPGFRIADTAETELLKADVLKELLEECYQEAELPFLKLVECYAPGKTDRRLEEFIRRLFLFSESYEWPEQWLMQQAESFVFEDAQEFAKSELLCAVMQEAKRLIALADADIAEADSIVDHAGLEGYRTAIRQDRNFLRELSKQSDYIACSEQIRGYRFAPIGRCKADVDREAKERAQELRNRCKKTVTKLCEDYFFQDFHIMYEDMRQCAAYMKELISLTLRFRRRYEAAKQERNLLEFSDLGHLALQILLTEQEGGHVPSEAARTLMNRFDRIMVDEYQDSNRIQETLLWAISRVHEVSADAPMGKPNVFAVGDVKQSIYKFRQACPELFMKKFDTYGQGNPAYEKIILKKNFRSRANVLDAVNSVFEWCMHREFGGIEYDADAALHVGRSVPQCDGTESPYDPELILLYSEEDAKELREKSEENGEQRTEEEEESIEKIAAEALVCARRIKQLTDERSGLMISDRNGERRACFGDVAILLRSAKGWAKTFVDVLKERGIPVTASVSSGFFEAGEVVTILNYLRILDNPRQDIPLAQVLLSPIGGFSNNDLAKIKCCSGRLYAIMDEAWNEETIPEEALRSRVKDFLAMYRYFRQRMNYLSVDELLTELYQKTEFLNVLSALPAGEQRSANLRFLLRQAKTFATTSFHGVFRFVRFVEKLRDNEVDLGEASLADTGNAVRIMTIHKSKGLEFPIVILAGCAKQFNRTDADARIVLHPEYGLGPEFVDSEQRTHIPTMKRKFIGRLLRREAVAEELRMLYVAMTRARDKLILVGSTGKLTSFFDSCETEEQCMDYRSASAAGSYLDFLRAVVPGGHLGQVNCLQEDNPIVLRTATTNQLVVWHFVPVCVGTLLGQESRSGISEGYAWELKKSALRSLLSASEETEKTSLYQSLARAVAYRYPFAAAVTGPVKTTVSELKRKASHSHEELNSDGAAIPPWLRESEEEKNHRGGVSRAQEPWNTGIGAAQRGTVYHRVLELIPFEQVRTSEEVSSFLKSPVCTGTLTEEELACVNPEVLAAFLKTPLAERIRNAACKGKLKREQPFVLGLECQDGSGDYELVQGMIDLFFEENGKMILLDYKSDAVDNAEELINRYRIQLALYQRAIQQLCDKPVSEVYLYSLTLRTTLLLPQTE